MHTTRRIASAVMATTAFVIVFAAAHTTAADGPCCAITAINLKDGTVAAKENSTGRTFTFKVTDAKLLGSLRVGQGIYANFTTKQVSLNGTQACCAIVGLPAGAATAAAQLVPPDLAPYVFYNPATPPCSTSFSSTPSPVVFEIPFGVFNAGPGTTTGTITVDVWTIPDGRGRVVQRVGSWSSSAPLNKSYRVVGKFRWNFQCTAQDPPWPDQPTYKVQVSLAGQAESRTDNNSVDLKIPHGFQIVGP